MGTTLWPDLEKNFFSPNWLIFGTRGFSGTRNRLRTSKNSEKFFGGQKIEKNASKLGVISFNPNKIILGDNFMRKIDSAHRKMLKIFSGDQKMEKIASKLGVISFNPNKIIIRSNFMRGIDCAHRKILKKFFSGIKKWKNCVKIRGYKF